MKNSFIILILIFSTTIFPKIKNDNQPILDLSLLRIDRGMKFVVLNKGGKDLTSGMGFFTDLIWDFKKFHGRNFKHQIRTDSSPFPRHHSFKLKDGDAYISNIAVIKKYVKNEYAIAPEGVKILSEILDEYSQKEKVNPELVEQMNLWVCSNLRYNIKDCD